MSEYGHLPLEATEGALIQGIEKLKIHDSTIYILDGRSNKNLLMFDMKGKFIGTVSKRGRGPREHIDLHNFEIDPIRQELLLLDKAGQKILIYDLDGKYRNTVKLSSGPECASRLANGNFVLAYVGSQLAMNDYYAVALCDTTGEVLSRHIKNDISVSMMCQARIYLPL